MFSFYPLVNQYPSRTLLVQSSIVHLLLLKKNQSLLSLAIKGNTSLSILVGFNGILSIILVLSIYIPAFILLPTNVYGFSIKLLIFPDSSYSITPYLEGSLTSVTFVLNEFNLIFKRIFYKNCSFLIMCLMERQQLCKRKLTDHITVKHKK